MVSRHWRLCAALFLIVPTAAKFYLLRRSLSTCGEPRSAKENTSSQHEDHDTNYYTKDQKIF